MVAMEVLILIISLAFCIIDKSHVTIIYSLMLLVNRQLIGCYLEYGILSIIYKPLNIGLGIKL